MSQPIPIFSVRSLLAAALLLGACQAPPPIVVNAQFAPTPAMAGRTVENVAVLPVEDGTGTGSAAKVLTLMRQEVERNLVDRLYSPLATPKVDAALRAAPATASGDSILMPAVLQKLAGHAHEDAVFALRVEKWDEGLLLIQHKVHFQLQAALVGSDGVQLWSGTIVGEVKAGGANPAPFDRDGKARSCAQLAVREMMLRLPRRVG
jgi:hypothetical protein